jgi:MarR family transcriptional regulator, transcriptional regulator for hemolysin
MCDARLAVMPEPFPVPIGLRLAQASRTVERAFDAALAEAGGSLPVWLVLLNLKVRRPANQRELAEAVGITGATLTHHLNAMHAQGLVARTRDDANRRVQVVTLTEAGESAFLRLREAAVTFDARLRAGFGDADLATLAADLDRLAANAGPGDSVRPWPATPLPLNVRSRIRNGSRQRPIQAAIPPGKASRFRVLAAINGSRRPKSNLPPGRTRQIHSVHSPRATTAINQPIKPTIPTRLATRLRHLSASDVALPSFTTSPFRSEG